MRCHLQTHCPPGSPPLVFPNHTRLASRTWRRAQSHGDPMDIYLPPLELPIPNWVCVPVEATTLLGGSSSQCSHLVAT